MLDDVISELDNERQSYLINSLGENQMFITTADISGKVIRIYAGGKDIQDIRKREKLIANEKYKVMLSIYSIKITAF